MQQRHIFFKLSAKAMSRRKSKENEGKKHYTSKVRYVNVCVISMYICVYECG